MNRRLSMPTLAVVGVCLMLPAGQAKGDSWDDLIADWDRKADAYHRRATQLGHDHVGTMHNERHVLVHRCMILGEVLGRDTYVKHLQQSYPDLGSGDGYELGLAARSLWNWARQAEQVKGLNEARRVEIWNLDCVGSMGIPDSAYVSTGGNPSTFYDIKFEGKILRVLGDVEAGFAQRVKDAVNANPGIKGVALGSRGGKVHEAIEAGRFIRARGLSTRLWAKCESACGLVFMGGTPRTIWRPYPQLGFHQISVGGKAVPFTDSSYSDVRAYVREMGGNPSAFVALMQRKPPQDMLYPDMPTLCGGNITTWVQAWCDEDGYDSWVDTAGRWAGQVVYVYHRWKGLISYVDPQGRAHEVEPGSRAYDAIMKMRP